MCWCLICAFSMRLASVLRVVFVSCSFLHVEL